jgi:small-conductance mechanosensitive channel
MQSLLLLPVALEVFGVKLVGLTAENGRKFLLTLAFVGISILLSWGLQKVTGVIFHQRRNARVQFWIQQAIKILATLVLVVGVLSIWFDNPARLTTIAGLMSAGLAIALQRVVTALAAYFVILRGKVFHIGDRIAMSGVRGDVIDLGFIRTTIMEMGQSPGEQGDEPSVWIESRQYTGRIVTVTNDKIFDDPVYNYSTDFPYIWEEMHLPIQYSADWKKAEEILLDTVKRHTVKVSEVAEEDLKELRRRYFVDSVNLEPRTYIRLTDNWLEMSVRFVTRTRGTRELKDKMSREILAALDAAGIGLASATYEIVGLPPLKIETEPARALMPGRGSA